MCGLCGALAGADHWSEASGAVPRAQARQVRTRLANVVLAHYGLKLGDWMGHAYVLGSRTGRTALVPHLGALWPAAERLAGRPLDPLDPALIAALERGAAGEAA